jgi:hypothetical protein
MDGVNKLTIDSTAITASVPVSVKATPNSTSNPVTVLTLNEAHGSSLPSGNGIQIDFRLNNNDNPTFYSGNIRVSHSYYSDKSKMSFGVQTADNILALEDTAITASVKVIAPACTTATASINLTPGTAPTTPANGDAWITTAGVFGVRLAGVTKSVTTT